MFLSIVLLYFNIRRYNSSIYLSVFIFLISMYAANQYVVIYSKSEFWISLIYTNFTFLSYLIGPVCFWYTRSVLSDNVRLKKNDLWHLLPMMIHLVASLPYIFSPYSYKVQIAKSIVEDTGFMGSYNATILSDWFSNTIIYLSRPISFIIYLGVSFWMLIRFKTSNPKPIDSTRHKFLYKWLIFFLGFQLLTVVGHLSTVYFAFMDTGIDLLDSNLFQSPSFIGLTGLIITPFFFPQILFGLPSFNSSEFQSDARVADSSLLSPEVKKRAANFEFQYMLSIIQKMATCMQEQQPYLQPDFNLSQFAVLLQVPTHHLAYFFREVKKQSFNDYRNECRVIHSKKLILEGKANELTLEAIGVLCGFTNRNTFFTAFKKVEGISPSAFVNQINS